MSFNDHLERDAAKLREEFGPAEAIVEVQNHGLPLLRAFCADQMIVKRQEEKYLIAAVPWHERRTKRDLRRFFAMEREEIDRRLALCESVAKAWGIK